MRALWARLNVKSIGYEEKSLNKFLSLVFLYLHPASQ
jgi:hypothetical protein